MIRIPKTSAQGVLALGLLLMLTGLLEAMDSNGVVTNVDPAIRSVTVLDDHGEVRTYRLRADGKVFIDGAERSVDDWWKQRRLGDDFV